MGVMKSHSF